MFSLQRILGKSDRFFDLLEAGAEEARQAVEALIELVNAPEDGRSLDKLIVSRRQEKQIHEELTALLCSTFITPLEREDIEALSNALSRITKVAKKFAQRLLATQKHVRPGLFVKQIALVEESAKILCTMVRELRKKAHLEQAQEQNKALHRCEGEADKLMLDMLTDLYCGQYEPLQMIVMRDLIELLEKVIDRFRDAGNVVFQIVLKNS
jgi:uncharacterized protein